ncbi:MAG: ParA family protein [Deltaproteobacteria bacterium]|nr:ParA family protein [Deltaproteobacteria bacterium]
MSYFCSQKCHEISLDSPDAASGDGADSRPVCGACGKRFELAFVYQVASVGGERRYFCSEACRGNGIALPARRTTDPRRIAVFNHKGGTGKTTTAVNLAAGLAERDKKVLLVDTDAQGNVGVSLGVRGERSLYHVIVLGIPPDDCAVPIRPSLDVLTSNETLAAAEIYLASRPARDRVLRDRLVGTESYDYVVLDCSPSLNLLNQNALVFSDAVLVPVSCDYLSLVGVKQVLRTIKNVNELLKHPVRIFGVLPTFYDVRNRICRDSVDALTQHFGDRVLAPVRVNTRLKEAPMEKKTIFEYAPDSNGAQDYLALVDAVLASEGAAHQEAAKGAA